MSKDHIRMDGIVQVDDPRTVEVEVRGVLERKLGSWNRALNETFVPFDEGEIQGQDFRKGGH